MLKHPAQDYQDPFLFQGLPKTWIQLGHIYWLELIDAQARLRFTSTATGRYVIVGPLGAKGVPYPDEHCGLVVPAGQFIELRVRINETEFGWLNFGPTESLVTRAIANKDLGFAISRGAGNDLAFTGVFISPKQKENIREYQCDHIAERQILRKNERDKYKDLIDKYHTFGALV